MTLKEDFVDMKGKIIVFEGLDGSGKATQSRAFFDKLKRVGKNVMQLAFPDYGSDSSALVRMYLNGEFGAAADAVNPYAASSFYAVDRYASYMKKWRSFYENGGIIIADRYTTSNAIHQCSKLPKEQWHNFIEWLFHYEHDLLGIPKADFVVYLRVDPRLSQKLMDQRYDGGSGKKDIHESDMGYLTRSRSAADYCADLLSWNVIECQNEDRMRDIEDIACEVFSKFEEKI